jgi:broad specificity phosphatase PhoE
MRLLLIRHGQTASNLKHLLDTAEPGPVLTAVGERQAAALPVALASEDIGALYASTLLRARLTAAPLASRTGLEVRVRPGIRELSAGALEMRGDAQAIETYLSTAFAWSAGNIERRMPGGGNGVEALECFDSVVEEAAGTGAETVAMVSHGAAIRMWVAARVGNIDVGYASTHELPNTGVVVLTGTPSSGWRVLLWDDRPLGPDDDLAEESGPAGEAVAPAASDNR